MQDEKRYPYDVFISYRWVTPDKEWVRGQLHPALVGAGLKVFLDVKDSVPGRDIILEMERGWLESRHMLCVISPEYFDEGRMVSFESLSARLRDPAGRHSSLIPLVVRKTEVPAWMRGLIRITWTDPGDYAREWKRLLLALGAANLNVRHPDSLPAGPHNSPDVFSSEAGPQRTGRPFRRADVRRKAVPRPWRNKKLRKALYVTAILLITTFTVLAIRGGFNGGGDTVGVNPAANPQASPEPTTAPTPAPTAAPTPSQSPPPSIQPARPRKGNPPPPPQRLPENDCSPRKRTLGQC